ncbi:MAG TPA: flagellar type III secretion system protein FliR [Firmicutes bacterium]|uniref:flagellar biosynthetic protein FliR n=1 Tax=Gelria sp. Kuro-4 TaxID=2796927 RepID=UPI0019BA8E39|nr:flagellar biosynthetic protein FliR [Gelria sp. Kuro-4]BCV24939.1 flagellar biosynthetic protein FliR [Gelria sp. Kuro-4]HHV56197.1 flagellar type III secretion system protein FliR [Bacillota bacterium]
MLDLTYWSQAYFLFLLLVARLGGFLTAAPFFGSRNIQPSLRFFLALLLALTFLPLFPAAAYRPPEALLPLALVLVRELVLGVVLGYAAGVILSAFTVAGQVLDLEIGFGIVNVFDPQSGVQAPLLGNLLYLMALVILLSSDGHHLLLQGLWTSWQAVPPGGFWGRPGLLWEAVRATIVMFIAGIEIAAPVLASIFLADLALAVVARTMPQLNIFVVGLPLKSILGLGVLALSLPAFGVLLRALLTEVQNSFAAILALLPPA